MHKSLRSIASLLDAVELKKQILVGKIYVTVPSELFSSKFPTEYFNPCASDGFCFPNYHCLMKRKEWYDSLYLPMYWLLFQDEKVGAEIPSSFRTFNVYNSRTELLSNVNICYRDLPFAVIDPDGNRFSIGWKPRLIAK